MKKSALMKSLSLFLALLMLLSCGITLIACGGEEQPDVPDVPDTPDEPDTPDAPGEPNDPDEPDIPGAPNDPDEPTNTDVGEDPEETEPVFEIIKLKNPLTLYGGKRPYGIYCEDSVGTSSVVEALAAWVEQRTGNAADYAYANAGSFKEESVKTPKILIGNLNMSWTASAREKMGDAAWIVSAEEKNIVILGATKDDVTNAIGCLTKAILYYTAHTQSAALVLPNDFCVTSKEGSDQFDMYTLTTKKSEQYQFTRYIVTSYCATGYVDDALCDKLIAGGYNAVQVGCGSVDTNVAALQKLAERGLYCDALCENRITSLAYANAADYTYEQVYDIVAQVNADYAGCSNLLGYFIIDEPNASQFEMLGMIVRAIREICPDKEGYINLFPSYASAQQLGAASFEEYVSSYLMTVNPQFLQVDNYTFNVSNEGRGNMSTFYFNDLAVLRKWAGYFGLDAEFIVQLDRWSEGTDQVGPTQVLWEVNMPLAYGFKRISYFTFFEYNGFANLYAGDFATARYEASKIANAATFKVGEELFTKESIAVYSYNNAARPVYEVSSLEVAYTPEAGLGTISGTGSAVIGTFDDGSVYFVNRAAYDGDADTYVLGGYTADLEWFDPADGAWKDASTCPAMAKTAEGWSITLAPANAVLFRSR